MGGIVLYIFGLAVILLFIILGLDDLIWDIAFIFRKNKSGDGEKIRMEELDAALPKLIAVIIAAWKEENVLGAVIGNLIETAQYPTSMYHIFLGVYPNDEKTLAVARKLSAAYENVHVIVNIKAGPTTKADNINNVLRHIDYFEKERGWEFQGFIIHDSEDVVHPYEFKLENYLLDKYDALQFPVFPLQQMPRLNNIFRNMTVGTYADEFAENHFHTMVARNRAEAFVPSAGTGFALSRKIVSDYNFDNIFPEDSLTEDYKLSLTLKQKGYRLHYVLEGIERVNDDGRIVREYVSTRSRFPATFQAAVRQKTRWIYGITMQSIKFKDIFEPNGMSFIHRYTLYKDWKAKFANLVNLFGYTVFIIFLLSLFTDLPKIIPEGSLSWYLSVFLTAMMVERQFLRAKAIKNVYGWRSVTVACLLPPLLPVRLVWGNIINLAATLKAWQRCLFGNSGSAKVIKKTKPPKWDKTDHEFLEKSVLYRFHRRLGDVLLEFKLITSEELRNALQISRTQGRLLGAVLRENNLLSEENLLRALAQVNHTIFVHLDSFEHQDKPDSFGWDLLETLQAVPLLRRGNTWAVAVSDESPYETRALLEEACGCKVYLFYSTVVDIKRAIQRVKSTIILPASRELVELHQRLEQGQINFEQFFLATDFRARRNLSVESTLEQMGLGHKPGQGLPEQNQETESLILSSTIA